MITLRDCISHVSVVAPSNDNVLDHVRALTSEDMETILDEHGCAVGADIDKAASSGGFANNPLRAFSELLAASPELQRWIVWYGSSLKRAEVDSLQEGGSLLMACCEVIQATRRKYTTDSLRKALIENLREFSQYLTSGGSL